MKHLVFALVLVLGSRAGEVYAYEGGGGHGGGGPKARAIRSLLCPGAFVGAEPSFRGGSPTASTPSEHALRACFATQLISTGIPATVVMKICGWQDMKTMQRYIRLAGIDEAGATEVLRFIPTEEAVMEKVVSMNGYKRNE